MSTLIDALQQLKELYWPVHPHEPKYSRAQQQQNLQRFRAYAGKNETRRQDYWSGEYYLSSTLSAVCSIYNKGTERRVANLFATIPDQDMDQACYALRHHLPDDDKPTSIAEENFRLTMKIIGGADVIFWAQFITALASGTNRIVPARTYPLFIAIIADKEEAYLHKPDHLGIRDEVIRPLTKERVNLLNGLALSEIAKAHNDVGINESEVEWFGEHRERVFPIWDVLIHDNNVTKARAETLLENRENSSNSLLNGAL